MDTSKLVLVLPAALLAALAQQRADDGNPLDKFLHLSDSDAIIYMNTAFDHGMAPEFTAGLPAILRRHSAAVLPILERRIEEALRSPNPLDAFSDKTVDARMAITTAAASIAFPENEYSLKEISKLLAIDDQRFGWLVGNALVGAGEKNYVGLIYHGFDLGSEPLNRRMIALMEGMFSSTSVGGIDQLKHWWAEAMIEKYGHATTEVDWANDPIATHLNQKLAWSLHDEVLRLCAEAAVARKGK